MVNNIIACSTAFPLWTFEWGTFWSAVGAIFTAVASIAIFLGILQLRFDAWVKAQEIFTEDEFVDARTKLFKRLDNPHQPWTDAERENATKVCRKMDEIARLVPFLSKKITLDAWDDPFAKAWFILEPVVREERERCDWSRKWKAFQDIGLLSTEKLRKERRNLKRQK